MTSHSVSRMLLLFVQAFIGLTALAGGVTLAVGSLDPGIATVLTPPVSYLRGSPFTGYLVPGIVLAVGLGGVHLVAWGMLVRRHRFGPLAAAVAAFDTLIWIFVELVIIPLSFWQLLYFAAGLTEFGLLLLTLGLLTRHTAVHLA